MCNCTGNSIYGWNCLFYLAENKINHIKPIDKMGKRDILHKESLIKHI